MNRHTTYLIECFVLAVASLGIFAALWFITPA